MPRIHAPPLQQHSILLQRGLTQAPTALPVPQKKGGKKDKGPKKSAEEEGAEAPPKVGPLSLSESIIIMI